MVYKAIIERYVEPSVEVLDNLDDWDGDYGVLFMGLFGEAVVGEKSQENGDSDGSSFASQRPGGMTSASWLVNWKCPCG